MIDYENGIDTVKTTGVLYSQPDAIRKMALMLLVSAAESNIDMVLDCAEEYKSKDDIEGVFAALNEQTLDMLEDHIADLRRSLESFLRNAKLNARVRRLDYNKNGELADISLDLSVE